MKNLALKRVGIPKIKTMEKTLIQRPGTRIYSIKFDFTSADQKQILQYLQENACQLMGFKGATGPNQISVGVPAWFAINFGHMFGTEEIYCEPEYKVYVFNRAVIEPGTTIHMQALSQEIPLGTAINFHSDGSFSRGESTPEGIITVKNERHPGAPNVIIGLAAKVNGVFQPFCAFTSSSQRQVSMKPNEKIVLFASQANMHSGDIVLNSMAPGGAFTFSAENMQYDLQIIRRTYGIANAPGAAPVDSIPAGQSLIQLLNT